MAYVLSDNIFALQRSAHTQKKGLYVTSDRAGAIWMRLADAYAVVGITNTLFRP